MARYHTPTCHKPIGQQLMKYFNLYYIAIIGVGCLLWHLNGTLSKEVIAFYGFADNEETEINFNHSVAVDKIYVSPGQAVKKDMPLLEVSRIKSNEKLVDQPYKIQELKAKEAHWKAEKEGQVVLIEAQKQKKIANLEEQIIQLQKEQAFQNSLYQDLKSIDTAQKNTSTFADKISVLEREKNRVIGNYDLEIQQMQQQISIGSNPYRVAIQRLEAEQSFEQENKNIQISIKAPSDGLMGNIYAKEGEHVPAYKTLASLYEPNPSLVKGYVQEDLILHVALQDSFLIRSTKQEGISCYGIVTGLGSRIVEIPERLRKVANLKTYGREILIQIPKQNNFLQKEKVILEFVKPPDGYTERTAKQLVNEIDDGR